MSWAAVIVGGSALVGSYMSSQAAGDAQDAANANSATADARANRVEARVNQALDALNGLTPPNLMQYVQPLQQQVLQGTLTPEEAVFRLQQDTALKGIKIDQGILDMQRQALAKVSQIADQGGLTAVDRARLLDIREQQNTQNRGMQEAITQNAAQRGVNGSGLELAQRLLAQQASANQASNAGTQVAADAQTRALQAIQQQSAMAGTMRNQDSAEQQAVANAQDTINRYNTSGWNATQAANTAERNSAAAANLAARQANSNYNASLDQQNAAARLAAAQQMWQNTFNQRTNSANVAAGQAGAALTANTAAQAQAQQAQQTANAQNAAAVQQLGTGLGQLVKVWQQPSTTTQG
jgi:hypothetical protein